MDEVREFCNRVLGPGPAAERVSSEARRGARGGRVELLAAAAEACRRHVDASPIEDPGAGGGSDELGANVARELRTALGELPERQREVLALRELLRLSHDQIAKVMGIDRAAVAPLIARSRLRLRAERRRAPIEQPGCPERERALRALVCRLDSEPLTADDDRWVIEHIGTCPECDRAHAAMLEASACYRAWPVQEAPKAARPTDGVAASSPR